MEERGDRDEVLTMESLEWTMECWSVSHGWGGGGESGKEIAESET